MSDVLNAEWVQEKLDRYTNEGLTFVRDLRALAQSHERLRGERDALRHENQRTRDGWAETENSLREQLDAAVRAGGNAADALAEIERIAIGGSDPADIQERLTDVWRVAREALETLEPEQTP